MRAKHVFRYLLLPLGIAFLLYLGVFLSAVYYCYCIIKAQKLPERELVFVAIFKLGEGLKPKQDPLPVVKQITLEPEAT